ncbi:PadR family transcriptional regulator [Pendulispora brunnea]|uniref:PadR family transcriptional regulator n=1 Tax=Pendulispora brunnea TaxID=2905690 RepID=A0ABZ2KMH1_9BACT
MYELIVLSLLMRQPTTGYLMAQIINDIIGPFAKASNGRIYPLLAALEKDKHITEQRVPAAQRSGRQATTYAITDRGSLRFRELMLDTKSSPREYRELFSYKVTAFDLLAPEERTMLVEHYAEFCKAHIAHIAREGEELARNAEQYAIDAPQRVLFASTFGHLESLWQNELAWCDRLRDELRALEASGGRKSMRRRGTRASE